jgi:hypothetical protein
MKAQRLKITQEGWQTYSDYLGSVKFENGISAEAVAPSVAIQLGALMSLEGIDDEAPAGAGQEILNNHDNSAEVVIPLSEQSHEMTVEKPVVVSTEKYTRESLEQTADEHGISGLRDIAEKFGVKGRGIVELIDEILQAQG